MPTFSTKPSTKVDGVVPPAAHVYWQWFGCLASWFVCTIRAEVHKIKACIYI